MVRYAITLATCLGLMLVAACTCKAEIAAVDRLGEQQEKLFKKYSVYVAADPKLDAKAKDDEMKLLESLRRLLASVRGSLD